MPNDIQRMSDESYPMLTRKVYNIEVEDHQTYFVGELGVWVHNQNCGEVVSASASRRPPITPPP